MKLITKLILTFAYLFFLVGYGWAAYSKGELAGYIKCMKQHEWLK